MKLHAEIRVLVFAVLVSAVILACTSLALSKSTDAAHPGARVLMDAHNCYPYFGWWSNRIERALSSGAPLAIEQDLFWFTDSATGAARSIVTHGAPSTGNEPSMREYFFERIRPIIEKALKDGTRSDWPLITLSLDLKSEEPAHLAAIWELLTEYRDWITTAPRTADIHTVAPLDVKPILVSPANRTRRKPSSTIESLSVQLCSSSAPPLLTHRFPLRQQSPSRPMALTTITAGGIIPGASSNPPAKQTPANGRQKRKLALRLWSATRTSTAYGFVSTPSTESLVPTKAVAAYFMSTISGHAPPWNNAGGPPLAPASITSLPINMKISRNCCAHRIRPLTRHTLNKRFVLGE